VRRYPDRAQAVRDPGFLELVAISQAVIEVGVWYARGHGAIEIRPAQVKIVIVEIRHEDPTLCAVIRNRATTAAMLPILVS
jgi:hypothetical protein